MFAIGAMTLHDGTPGVHRVGIVPIATFRVPEVGFHQFGSVIFDANPHTSFDDFIKFVFTERKTFNGAGDLTTQEDIIEGSGVIKVKQYFASKFVVLFNEYCLTRKCRVDVKSLKGKIAIPESCDEWSKLTEILTPSMKRLFSTEKM